MDISIFIRTHAGDTQWLAHCLASLRKYANGQKEIVIAAPEDQYDKVRTSVDTRGCVLVACERWSPDDYIGQQITKLRADSYCKGDAILHVDSDCVAQRDFHVTEFLDHVGTPLMTFRPWEEAGTAACWRDITRDVVRCEPAFEFMPQLPIIHRATTLMAFRDHLARVHGEALAYLSSRKTLSEFNAVGAFAHHFHPEDYRWIRAGADDGYPRPLKQYWSRGGITHDIEVEINHTLGRS